MARKPGAISLLACTSSASRRLAQPERPVCGRKFGSLAGTATIDRQIEAQLRAVSAAERRLALSNLRYQAGFDGRLELLDAQRQLYAARQALLELRGEDIVNTVGLYKSLGGGLRQFTA